MVQLVRDSRLLHVAVQPRQARCQQPQAVGVGAEHGVGEGGDAWRHGRGLVLAREGGDEDLVGDVAELGAEVGRLHQRDVAGERQEEGKQVAQHGSIDGSLGSGGRSLYHQKHEEVHRVFHELRAQQLGCRRRHVR